MVDGSKQLDWVPENQKAKTEAEKIYATLRECRDQAGLKKMRGIKVCDIKAGVALYGVINGFTASGLLT